jgi:hypothetical protein
MSIAKETGAERFCYGLLKLETSLSIPFQEEYAEGEEVGRLPCEHRYHVCCIGQWLGQKNWCPVCKASAVPSKG